MNKYKVRCLKPDHICDELLKIGFDQDYASVAADKFSFNIIKIFNIKSPAANILKQTALSKDADLGVSSEVVTCAADCSDAILAATDKQLKEIIKSIRQQHFGLKTIAIELENLLKQKYQTQKTIKFKYKSFDFGSKAFIMGVLNITPDSFSDGGKFFQFDSAINAVKEMIDNGADIIDIGGESTKPYSKPVDTEEQLKRILPVIREIKKQFPDTVLSVDTRDHKVAEQAIEFGAEIINDVSGMQYDNEMVSVVSANSVAIIIMHSLETPETMQVNPVYENLMDDISTFLLNGINKAVAHGIAEDKIIIDPGIGFGKTLEHNLEIIRRVSEFKSFGYPLIVGASRKKFIGTILEKDVTSREEGTAAVNSYLVSQGVDIIRVHDVKYHSQFIKTIDSIVRI